MGVKKDAAPVRIITDEDRLYEIPEALKVLATFFVLGICKRSSKTKFLLLILLLRGGPRKLLMRRLRMVTGLVVLQSLGIQVVFSYMIYFNSSILPVLLCCLIRRLVGIAEVVLPVEFKLKNIEVSYCVIFLFIVIISRHALSAVHVRVVLFVV
jgi:hypothetical protein